MEKVTPLDLERAQIPRSFKGYNPESVDQLLSSASQQLETQLMEIRRLQQLLTQAESSLAGYRLQESNLHEALMLAQKTADEVRSNAQKEATLIVEQAKADAREIKRRAQDSVLALKMEAERLEMMKRESKQTLIATYRSCLETLEAAPSHAVLVVESAEVASG